VLEVGTVATEEDGEVLGAVIAIVVVEAVAEGGNEVEVAGQEVAAAEGVNI
tara:strand:- start:353 stop:505 length:153 start_codon:yes stop_codon:yes gene_type:complete